MLISKFKWWKKFFLIEFISSPNMGRWCVHLSGAEKWNIPGELGQQLGCWCPKCWFNTKMSSYQYRKSHCGDKTVVRLSYLHNGISYTGKMSSLYWIGALALCLPSSAIQLDKYDKLVIVFPEERFKLPAPFLCWGMIENANTFWHFQQLSHHSKCWYD